VGAQNKSLFFNKWKSLSEDHIGNKYLIVNSISKQRVGTSNYETFFPVLHLGILSWTAHGHS